MNPVQIRCLAWIACMEAYLNFPELGVPACAARFEDLTTEPVSILGQFFSFCGIETIDWAAIHEVLGRDSQAGTMFDREERRKNGRELTDDLVQFVLDMVADRPLLRSPDVIVPNTFHPSRV